MGATIKSINLIELYEIDGEEVTGIESQEMKISNHWNRREFVNIEFEGKQLTVLADELKRSVDNAQNAHKH